MSELVVVGSSEKGIYRTGGLLSFCLPFIFRLSGRLVCLVACWSGGGYLYWGFLRVAPCIVFCWVPNIRFYICFAGAGGAGGYGIALGSVCGPG